MERIAVLHVIESFGAGTLEVLRNLVNGMSNDFQHYVLFNMRAESPKVPESVFKPGVKMIRSRHLTREITPSEDWAAIWELRKVFDEIQPDVVHLYSTKAGAIGRLALIGKKVPIFYSPQGYSFLMHQCAWAQRKKYYILEKILGCLPGETVASCKGEYDSAKTVSLRATYIENGVNTDELDGFDLNFEKRPKKIIVCTLGRIVPQKDPELFNRIAEALPEVKFVWIGCGELQDKLTSPNIEVTGWVTKEQALNKMMGCSVFMLTSLYEGLAFSVMEAMYFKRLCIVSKIPGNVDAIEDGVTGFVCGRFEEYVAVIRKLLQNGIDPNMLQRARERILKQLNQHVMARSYEELYLKNILRIRKAL